MGVKPQEFVPRWTRAWGERGMLEKEVWPNG